MNNRKASERCTNFSSRFTRRPSGGFTRRKSGGLARRLSGGFIRRLFYPPFLWRDEGQFSVKVVVIKRNANQSLSVTKTKAIYSVFPGTVTRLGRGLPASGVAY